MGFANIFGHAPGTDLATLTQDPGLQGPTQGSGIASILGGLGGLGGGAGGGFGNLASLAPILQGLLGSLGGEEEREQGPRPISSPSIRGGPIQPLQIPEQNPVSLRR